MVRGIRKKVSVLLMMACILLAFGCGSQKIDEQASEESTQSSEVNVQSSEENTQSSEVKVQSSEESTQSAEVKVQSQEESTQSAEVKVQSLEESTQSAEVNVQSSEEEVAQQQVQIPSKPDYGRILFVGDSRTVDIFSESASELSAYSAGNVVVYARDASNHNYLIDTVNAYGFDNFDTLVSWMGANDYGDFASYEGFYDSVLASGKTLILCTVGPTDDNCLAADDRPYYDNERIVSFNVALNAWASKHGVKVIDLYTYVSNNVTIDAADGIHYGPKPTSNIWGVVTGSF